MWPRRPWYKHFLVQSITVIGNNGMPRCGTTPSKSSLNVSLSTLSCRWGSIDKYSLCVLITLSQESVKHGMRKISMLPCTHRQIQYPFNLRSVVNLCGSTIPLSVWWWISWLRFPHKPITCRSIYIGLQVPVNNYKSVRMGYWVFGHLMNLLWVHNLPDYRIDGVANCMCVNLGFSSVTMRLRSVLCPVKAGTAGPQNPTYFPRRYIATVQQTP